MIAGPAVIIYWLGGASHAVTVRANLLWARPGASEAEVREALVGLVAENPRWRALVGVLSWTEAETGDHFDRMWDLFLDLAGAAQGHDERHDRRRAANDKPDRPAPIRR